jgi:type IV secretory pathway VirB10-like protein
MTEPEKVEKVDPETLVLRAKPRGVIRIKRNLLIGLAGGACVGLVGLTWLGLSPSLIQPVTPSVDDKDPEKHKSGLPDQVAGLPKTYADVPQLGAPLPGDLGKPILEHRQLHGDETMAEQGAPASAKPSSPAADSTSGLFFQTGATIPAELPARSNSNLPATDNQSLMPLATGPQASSPSAAQTAFLERDNRSADINPYSVQVPASPNIVMAGTVISASLITGLNSDLPGTILAQVTSDVHNFTGRVILIPQGTRLIGKYDNTISFGQSRALIVWQRLIWPDGRSLQIDNMPASDMSGYAGLYDHVSFHSASLLKGIGLSTLLGLTGELGNDDDHDLVKALRQSVQQTANEAGQKIVTRQLDVAPTLQVRSGWPLRVIVQKDLIINADVRGIDDDRY